MKKIITASLITMSAWAFGQIKALDTIEVNYDKTVYLLFDSKVLTVDVGNGEELIETHTDKKVLLKAGEEDFQHETNILVETETAIFSYMVRYRKNPSKLLIMCPDSKAVSVKDISGYEKERQQKEKEASTTKKEPISYEKLQEYISIVEEKEGEIEDVGVIKGKMSFFLKSLYVQDDYIFVKVCIENRSAIAYDINHFSFIVKNAKGKVKQSAVQEDIKSPFYATEQTRIEGKSSGYMTIVFNKFTISGNKKLFLDVWEKEGDRYLLFPIDSQTFNSIKPLKSK